MSTSPTPQSESIQLLLDEMRDCFIDELPEKINRIELLLLQLEKIKTLIVLTKSTGTCIA